VSSAPSELDLAGAVAAARALAADGRRRLLGVTGPPGAGKSTVTAQVARALGSRTCVVVPMDGFHLAQTELDRLGRADRKGAPDTFDAAGYVALLRRLRAAAPAEVVWAPTFRREIEEPIAGAISVPGDVPLVVTEGNYLLDDDGPWADVRRVLDEIWYVDVDDAVRVPRLVARHVAFGRTPEDATAWVLRSDEANAARVKATRHRADRIVRPG
jgi:pantothenate kinase